MLSRKEWDWLRDVKVDVPVRFIEGRVQGKAAAGRYAGSL
jgi:hypothetical protein